MTNAEKYLKEGVIYHELACEIALYMSNSLKNGVVQNIDDFFKQQTKPTLTEDERVILRNIQLYTGNPVTIRRIGDGHLYISGGCGFIDFGEYNHLFQFIKERRRI